jgi:PPOX class probable F420-dependent enzyme
VGRARRPGPAFWTPAGTGKVKRIRNSGRVTVAACDVHGNVRGAAIEARARIGDAGDLRRVGEGLKRKYGLMGRLSLLGSKLRRAADGTPAILVS